jgi:hypothetical protein
VSAQFASAAQQFVAASMRLQRLVSAEADQVVPFQRPLLKFRHPVAVS